MRPPRRRAVPRPGAPTRRRSRRGSSSSASTATTFVEAHHRVRRSASAPDVNPARLVFHCELAWLASRRSRSATCWIDVDGDRSSRVERGVAAPPGAVRLGRADAAGVRQRPQPRVPPRPPGADPRRGGTFWTWRDQMYRWPRRSTPTRTRTWRRATFAEMVLAGFTVRRGVPLPAPRARRRAVRRSQRDGRRTVGCGRRRGHPDHAARHVLPARRHRTRRRAATPEGTSAGSATAPPRRGPSASSSSRPRVAGAGRGSARPSTRCGPSIRRSIDGRRRVGRRAGCVLHAHVSEQPAENEQCHEAFKRYAGRAARRARRGRRRRSRPCTRRT